jgi:hypothetical protein
MWKDRMKASKTLLISLALAAPVPAFAQATTAASPASDFQRLWTGWGSVNRDAMTTESDAVQRLRREIAAADAEHLRRLGNQGRALGERVGEIVRLGDCEDGERVARQAGDFALVEAVRGHCRPSESQTQPDSAR